MILLDTIEKELGAIAAYTWWYKLSLEAKKYHFKCSFNHPVITTNYISEMILPKDIIKVYQDTFTD